MTKAPRIYPKNNQSGIFFLLTLLTLFVNLGHVFSVFGANESGNIQTFDMSLSKIHSKHDNWQAKRKCWMYLDKQKDCCSILFLKDGPLLKKILFCPTFLKFFFFKKKKIHEIHNKITYEYHCFVDYLYGLTPTSKRFA